MRPPTLQEQRNMVRTFQEITNQADEAASLEALRNHAWNLDRAVETFMSNQEDSPTNPVPESAQRRSSRSQVPREGAGQFQFLVNMASGLLDATLGTLAEVSGDVDGATAADRFGREFDETYGTNHVDFVNCTYLDALNQAKQFDRLIAVYLHSKEHPRTKPFCRRFWCDDQVTQFFNEKLMVWAGDVDYEDGYRASVALQAATFPFLGVMMVEKTSPHKVKLLARFEGKFTFNEIAPKLTVVCDQFETIMADRIATRNESFERQQLREEQDLALERAIEEDRRRDEERRKKAEEEARQKEREEQEQKQRQDDLDEKRARFGDEPPKSSVTANLRLYLPNGTTIQRRFLRADTIGVVRDYVDVQMHDKNLEIKSYSLSMNFPKQTFHESDSDKTLQEAGLCPQAALYLHDLDA